MKQKYLYGGRPAEVESAAGVKGTIIRAFDGAMTFRVYRVTISEDSLAAFYKVSPRAGGDGERDILDHSPEVLGLKKI